MKKMLLLGLLLFFLFGLLLLTILNNVAFAQGAETPICTHPAGQYSPAIWGDRIVWTDYRNNAGDDNNDIYMYDLSTGQEKRITTALQHQGEPAIWENRIVWSDYRNGSENVDIYMYDILADVETPICTNPQRQSTPSIWGDKIVWYDFRNYGIYMYDLYTQTESTVRANTGSQPHIWQDRVVWEDVRDGYRGIYLTELSTGIETPICTGPEQQAGRPLIWGDKIIWSDYRSGAYLETYMYDLSTGEEKRIAEGYNPDIWEHLITYLRNCGVDCSNIYVYNIKTGIETQIPNTSTAGPPRINNNRIVWEDHRNGNSDIYMYSPIVPRFALSATKEGTGQGSVFSEPPGISCGSTCSASFIQLTEVTMTAVADSGSVFSYWSGSCSGTGNRCTLIMTEDFTLTAHFVSVDTKEYKLAVGKKKINKGDGAVQSDDGNISCGETCTALYFSGSPVTLMASPSPGNIFEGWSPTSLNCGTSPTCSFTMDTKHKVKAIFRGPYRLATKIKSKNEGSGSVTADISGIGTGINCPASSCEDYYPYGNNVVLTAQPGGGSQFIGWKPASLGCGINLTCTVPMAKKQSVTATFEGM